MSNTLYSQLVHLCAVVALAVLVGIGKLDVTTGVSGIAVLVGIALPSPFVTAASVTVPKGVTP